MIFICCASNSPIQLPQGDNKRSVVWRVLVEALSWELPLPNHDTMKLSMMTKGRKHVSLQYSCLRDIKLRCAHIYKHCKPTFRSGLAYLNSDNNDIDIFPSGKSIQGSNNI